MTARNTLSPGTMLRQYRIESVLGQGGFGITYLAYDTDLQRKVAIKECFPRDFVSREGTTIVPTSGGESKDFSWALGKFVDEATTLARFRHPGIVQVLQILKEENNTACMVLEYIDGQSLEKWLKIRPHPPTEIELKRVLTPMIDALQVVHENGIVHRDIAPDNIYIRKNGQAVLLDFGAAKQIFGQHSRTMNLIVKDGYSAPEQYYAEGRQGPWTDIYAFASVIYRAITGARPIDAMARLDAINNDEPDPLVPLEKAAPKGYSPEFLSAVTHGLAPQVKSRPQGLPQWRSMLLGNEQASASHYQPKPVEPKTGKTRTGSGIAKIAAAIAVLLAVVGGFYLFQKNALDSEEADWAQTIKEDSLSGYNEFLDKYPDSTRREAAISARRPFTQPWSRSVGTTGAEKANAVAISKDTILVAGATSTSGEKGVQALVQAFSLAGREKWRAEFGSNGSQIFHDLIILPDGEIVAAGVTKSGSSKIDHAYIVRMDASGNAKWTKTFDSGAGAGIFALENGESGSVLAAGYMAAGPNGNDDGWVVSLNGFGDKQWERIVGGPANDAFRSLAKLPGGELALAGDRGNNFWLLKQASDGSSALDRSPGGASRDTFSAVASSPDGQIVAVGQTESFGTGTVDGMIMRLTEDGKMPPKVLAESKDDYLTSVVYADDGGILVAGYTSSRGAGQTDGWVRKYDSQLSRLLWERVIGGTGWDTIQDVALLEDNSIMLTGSTDSQGAGSSDVWLVRMGSDGQYAGN